MSVEQYALRGIDRNFRRKTQLNLVDVDLVYIDLDEHHGEVGELEYRGALRERADSGRDQLALLYVTLRDDSRHSRADRRVLLLNQELVELVLQMAHLRLGRGDLILPDKILSLTRARGV